MSSSYSFLLAGRELDVFLSFSGKVALDLDLGYDLSRNGIKSFKSESWKENTFKPIDQRTLEALTESKVAVVMTSDEEASSVGFLEELMVIVESHEKRSLTVIPIFLTKHPLDVGQVFQSFPERAQIWKTAIAKLDSIAAQYSFSRNLPVIHGTHRIKQIADDIRLMFLSSASSDFKGLAGMDRHMKAFHDLLALESDKEVRTIGIWGGAGVGKTTLARYTYADISVKFQAQIFLENMKEMLLPSEIFQGEDLRGLDHELNELTEAKKKHRKVIFIADGVRNIEQGKWITEYANWFAPGSRVILITQEKSLLVESGVNHVYEVGSLRYDEALKLLSRFAFKQSYPPPDFERLSVRAVQLAGFLPVTIRLFGSFLTGRDKEEWEATLLKLNAKQCKDLMEVWKIMEASEDEEIVEASQS
ncbi:PREDICTED: putative disease resistance protein At4g11170 [Camelina sativa]|uniref:Disease resistance protein At4g11170 n=1 Tax=Camelina sativa TaxID=90675 RepID=A0ABM0VPR9_CAMSA|nr:PREDICTED: putative disease resistance protein At4g11170 [Camelina sativa]